MVVMIIPGTHEQATLYIGVVSDQAKSVPNQDGSSKYLTLQCLLCGNNRKNKERRLASPEDPVRGIAVSVQMARFPNRS